MNLFVFDDLEDHIDFLADIIAEIDLTKVSILTGNNSTGKSLVRRQLIFRVEEANKVLKSVSMDVRTAPNLAFGALSGLGMDQRHLSTSFSSLNLLDRVFKDIKTSEKDVFLILDEIEIGCSEETTLALAEYVNNSLKELGVGCLIISHSKTIVRNIESDNFYNLQKMTKEDWLSREIKPTNLDELRENKLFKQLQKSI